MIDYQFFTSKTQTERSEWHAVVTCKRLIPEFHRHTTNPNAVFAETLRVRRVVRSIEPRVRSHFHA